MTNYSSSDTGSSITHTCDKCGKLIPKWDVHYLIDRCYSPGERYNICSSDIRVHTHKIMELCPECMNKVCEIYTKKED